MYILLLLATWLVLCSVYYVMRVRSSRLYQGVFRYPPCLRELPVVGSVYHLLGNSEDVVKTLLEIGNNTIKAGGISRLYGLNKYYLLLTDPADIAAALSTYLEKDYFYTFLQVMTGNGSVFVPSSSVARARRRAILPAFSSRMLAGYAAHIRAESARLTAALAPHAGQGPFRAEPHIAVYCCRNLIRASGIEDVLQELNPSEILQGFSRAFQLVFDRWRRPWVHADLLYKWTADGREMDALNASFSLYANRAQEIRRNKLKDVNLQKTKGLLDSLIGSELSAEEVSEEIKVFVGATEEATLAMGFALLLLGQYPAAQDTAYAEIRKIFGDSDRPLDKDDLGKMCYLDMVIKESMRLYPPVPYMTRYAHKGIELPSGRVIPAGAGVVIPVMSLHRSPLLWGADAEHFDPERFLPARLAALPDHAYMPFSHGPRGCPGYKFGSDIVKIGLCGILRKYKIVGEPAPGPPRIRLKFEVVLKTVDNVQIQLVARV